MTFERLHWWLLACALLLALPAPSAAQDDFERTIREALTEFEAGRWIEARALFLQAHGIRPSAEALRMAGNASYEAREYVRAVELLEAALAVESPPLREERAALAREALAAAGRFVTRLTVVAPEGARVRVDDIERDASEPIVLARGEHRVEASAPGFETRRERVVLSSTEQSVTLELRASAPEPRQAPIVAAPPATAPGPVAEPEEPADRSLTWLWVTLGVVGAVAVGAVAVTLATRDADAPLGADAPGRVVYALELGR